MTREEYPKEQAAVINNLVDLNLIIQEQDEHCSSIRQ
jgi:hypothetical protein